MDALPILGAFVGGIGGGIFASRMVRMQLDKFKSQLADYEFILKGQGALFNNLKEEVQRLKHEEEAWKTKWGAPLQESINALSAKLEGLPRKRKI